MGNCWYLKCGSKVLQGWRSETCFWRSETPGIRSLHLETQRSHPFISKKSGTLWVRMKYLNKGPCSYPFSQKLIVAQLMHSESRALLPSHAFLSLMISNSLVNKTESWLPGSRQSPCLCDGASACVHLLHGIKPWCCPPRASRSIFLSLAVQASSIPPVDLVP